MLRMRLVSLLEYSRGSTVDLAMSFAVIRGGGHVDATILGGALEVDQEGNIANWACRQGRGGNGFQAWVVLWTCW